MTEQPSDPWKMMSGVLVPHPCHQKLLILMGGGASVRPPMSTSGDAAVSQPQPLKTA